LSPTNGLNYKNSTQSIEIRWKKHYSAAKNKKSKSIIYAGIRKYGKNAFTIEELYQSTDLEYTLNVKEKEFIVEYKTHVSEGGYNLTMGGEGTIGYIPSEETRRKLSVAGKGRVHSEESKQKISEAGKRRISVETRQTRAEGRKDRILLHGFSEEHKRNLSKSQQGRVFSEEHRRKLSESQKRRIYEE